MIDDWVIGLVLTDPNDCYSKTFFLNVYLPCDSQIPQALDNYRSSLAQLDVIIKEQNFNNFVLFGVLDADPFKGRFWREILKFALSLS